MNRESLGYFTFLLRIKNRFTKKKRGIRILMYHDIEDKELEKFEEQIKFLNAKYGFIGMGELKTQLERGGGRGLKSEKLMISFDDGFYSAYEVSNILDKYGIKGLFFIPTGFIQADRETLPAYVVAHELTDEYKDGKCPLTWDQIIDIRKRGHDIGAHTSSHCRISRLDSIRRLQSELCESKKILENKLGEAIDKFAFPFGNIESIDSVSLAEASKQYNFIFSGIRGENHFGISPLTLRRDQISPQSALRYMEFIIEGGLDMRYAKARKRLDHMIGEKEYVKA